MLKECEHAAAIVVNPRSGDGKRPLEIAYGLADSLPAGYGVIYNFYDVVQNPRLIEGRNGIGVGGDGTHGTLATKHYRHAPSCWYLPLDASTVGVIPKSLGLGRTIGESSRDYAARIAHGLTTDAYEVTTIPLGDRRSAERQSGQGPAVSNGIFFWNIGMGRAIDSGLHIMEQARNGASPLRRLSIFTHSVYCAMKHAQPHTIIFGGHRRTVFEALVNKNQLKNFGVLSLPYPGRDIVVTIPYGERVPTAGRILLDLAMMAGRLRPRAHGLDVLPLRAHEVVIFEGSPAEETTGHIDSELGSLSLPTAIQSNVPHAREFLVVTNNGSKAARPR